MSELVTGISRELIYRSIVLIDVLNQIIDCVSHISVFRDYAVDPSYHPVGHKLLDLRLVLEPLSELLGIAVVEAPEPLRSNKFLPEVERLPLIGDTLASDVATGAHDVSVSASKVTDRASIPLELVHEGVRLIRLVLILSVCQRESGAHLHQVSRAR